MEYLGRREFAEAINISYTTLGNWLRKEIIKPAFISPTGHAYFTKQQVNDYFKGVLKRGVSDEII